MSISRDGMPIVTPNTHETKMGRWSWMARIPVDAGSKGMMPSVVMM